MNSPSKPLDGDIIGPREGLVTVAEDVPRDDRLDALEYAALSVMGMAAGLSFFAPVRFPETNVTIRGSSHALEPPYEDRRHNISYAYEQRKRQEQQALAVVRDREQAKQAKADRKKKEAARARARNKRR